MEERILHICTFEHGGAAIAAKRQNDALRDAGCDSTFMALRVSPIETPVLEETPGRLILNVPENLWSYHGALTTNYFVGNRTEISNTWFSLWPTKTLLDDVFLEVYEQYDVLHFHWTSGMFSSWLAEQLRSLGKKILFTSHDMNYFTGGCHYNAGCRRFEQGCDDCLQVNADPLQFVACGYNEKISSLSSLNATWLFPSHWLAAEFRASSLAKEKSQVIHNCANTDLFYPVSGKMKQLLREKLGFNNNDVVIVAGAQDNTEIRKGFSVLEYAITELGHRNIGSDTKVVVVTFGKGKPEIPEFGHVRHMHLGMIAEGQVAELFQASDLIAFPSFEDNFPNVVLEGLLCGCPVLAFRIGGIPDIVEHGVNGHIVETEENEAFSSGLAELVVERKLQDIAETTLLWAEQNQGRFSPGENAQELLTIYKDAPKGSNGDSIHLTDPAAKAFYQGIFELPEKQDLSAGYAFASRLKDYQERNERLESCGESPSCMRRPAIWLAPPEKEFSPQMGPIHWARMQNRFYFVSGKIPGHYILLQIPNNETAQKCFAKAQSNLELRLNGKTLSAETHQLQNTPLHSYLCVKLPHEALSDTGLGNVIDLSLSEPTIPLEHDPRGLGFIFSNLLVVSGDPAQELLDISLIGLLNAYNELAGELDRDSLARTAADFINQWKATNPLSQQATA